VREYFASIQRLTRDYLRQEGYVIVVVCLSVSNLVQKRLNRLAWNFHGRFAMANEQKTIRIRICIRIRIRIATLRRRSLAEVCTVPVLLVTTLTGDATVSLFAPVPHTFAYLLVHGQVTIIFVVSVCLFVCLSVCLFVCFCTVFLSRLRSDFDQTRKHVTCPGL